MISCSQLEKKLHRACRDSGLSDDEMIRALTATLVRTIVSSCSLRGDWQQRLRQLAKSTVCDILDRVSVDTQAAKALGAELFSEMREAH